MPLPALEMDMLVALVEHGPLPESCIPVAGARDALVRRGLAVLVVVMGAEGFTAATPAGAWAYRTHYGTALDGDGTRRAETIAEAMANRQALLSIMRAKL